MQQHANNNEKWFIRIIRADGGLAPSDGGDDGVVGGPRTPQQIAAQRRLQQTQAQVDEVSLMKWMQLSLYEHLKSRDF